MPHLCSSRDVSSLHEFPPSLWILKLDNIACISTTIPLFIPHLSLTCYPFFYLCLETSFAFAALVTPVASWCWEICVQSQIQICIPEEGRGGEWSGSLTPTPSQDPFWEQNSQSARCCINVPKMVTPLQQNRGRLLKIWSWVRVILTEPRAWALVCSQGRSSEYLFSSHLSFLLPLQIHIIIVGWISFTSFTMKVRGDWEVSVFLQLMTVCLCVGMWARLCVCMCVSICVCVKDAG